MLLSESSIFGTFKSHASSFLVLLKATIHRHSGVLITGILGAELEPNSLKYSDML